MEEKAIKEGKKGIKGPVVADGRMRTDKRLFDYGDFVIVCKCGRTQILEKGVNHAVQFTLVPREDSFVQLVCDECGAEIKLGFEEGEKPEAPVVLKEAEPTEEAPISEDKDEDIHETPKTEEKESINEDVQKEDKQ